MPDQLTEARDQIAEMCGWIKKSSDSDGVVRWFHPDSYSTGPVEYGDRSHPIPACLNFVSRVWPQRFYWQRSPFSWSALEINRKTTIRASKTSDELADRMTLLLKVLVWLRDNDRPAFDAACEKIRKEIQG